MRLLSAKISCPRLIIKVFIAPQDGPIHTFRLPGVLVDSGCCRLGMVRVAMSPCVCYHRLLNILDLTCLRPQQKVQGKSVKYLKA